MKIKYWLQTQRKNGGLWNDEAWSDDLIKLINYRLINPFNHHCLKYRLIVSIYKV